MAALLASSLALLSALDVAAAAALPALPSSSSSSPASLARRNPIAPAAQTFPLTRNVYGRGHARAAGGPQTGLTELLYGQEFAVNVSLGGQSVSLILDTGSSDTWVVASNFSCVDSDGSEAEQSECEFGPAYTPTSTFEGSILQNENLNISYGDGEFVTGVFGFENVGLGNLTVNQQVAVVDYAYWQGDGSSSGLIGFAYPNITSAYSGSDPSQDTYSKALTYSPFVTTAFQQNAGLEQIFSLAIGGSAARSGDGGYLAIGGIPDVSYNDSFATAPLIYNQDFGSSRAEYTIEVSGMTYAGSGSDPTAQTSFAAIIDSGTTLVYVPDELAQAVNSVLDPDSEEYDGYWYVNCTTRPPADIGVTIGGATFFLTAESLILENYDANGEPDGTCLSGIAANGEDPVGILGDVFLTSVVAVFDVGNSEMRFAARTG